MRRGASLAGTAVVLLIASWAAAAGPDAEPSKAVAVSDKQAEAAKADFEAGRELFFQRKYKEAVAKLAAAAKADPTKSSYRLLLAKAHKFAGNSAESTALLEQILKENPEHVEAAVELGDILAAAKDWKRIVTTLEPLLKFKHDYPLYHLLAEAYYQQENLNKARKFYEEAVRLNPRSGDDFYQLANIYLMQNRFAKAAEAYEKAAALGIDTGVLHFKLASAYFNLRNYLGRVTTAEVLGGAVGRIKDDLYLVDPVPGRKDTFYVAGPKSAVYQVAKARAMGIDVPQIEFLTANIWLNARRFAKADAIYKAMEKKVAKADRGLFWFYWAQTALGLDDYDGYLARLNKAIEAEPDLYKPTLADAYITVAARYQQRGDTKKYIAYLEKAVSTNPLSAGLHLTLGDALWQANRRAEAAERYRLVLELQPDHPQRVRLLNRIRGGAATAGTP